MPTSQQPSQHPIHARRVSRERLTTFQQRARKKGAGRLTGTALTVRHDSLQGGSSPLPAGCAAAWRAVFGICTALFVVGLIGSASFACLKNNCWRTHQAKAAPLRSLSPPTSPRISFLLLTYLLGVQQVRSPTGPLLGHVPMDTAALHGKLYFLEDDSRTVLSVKTNPHPEIHTTTSIRDTLRVLQRNLMTVGMRSCGCYLYDLDG